VVARGVELLAVIFSAHANGEFHLGGQRTRCVLGAGGVTSLRLKQEGDKKTPAGSWPFRRVLYRPDRRPAPATRLPVSAVEPDDGWCDAPADPRYNQPVKLPYPASAETLWREDSLYDLVVVLGYNDDPVVPGKGSAIFLHLARPDGGPTEGCVALETSDLERLLALAAPGDSLAVLEP
jgi:L,D-peptidoglycan transpeptidase YkuD (ErfK/YbiS/YcfS/YnhG family)